jgi:hypothetical protein
MWSGVAVIRREECPEHGDRLAGTSFEDHTLRYCVRCHADVRFVVVEYVPRSQVEGAVDLVRDLLEFVEAMDGDRPKSLGPLKVVVRAREFLTRAGGQS